MITTKEIIINLAMAGERFYLDLKVRSDTVRPVLVREVHWYQSDYDNGTVTEHLLAVGRWKRQNGVHSMIDARAHVKEDQLPPAVLAKLKGLRGD